MINVLQPTYTLELPSNGKKIKYRPFVVKEEKSLLLAMQEGDPETVVSVIKSLVSVCTDNSVDPDNIPYYDLEYIFLKIRAKSVGETLELIGGCDCSEEAKTTFFADLEEVKVVGLDQKGLIPIEGTEYHLQMKHPSIDTFLNKETSDLSVFETTAGAIDSILTRDEVKDSLSISEKVGFLESLTSKQQKPIADFLRQMPMIRLDTKYRCKACGKEHSVNVSGLENFFV